VLVNFNFRDRNGSDFKTMQGLPVKALFAFALALLAAGHPYLAAILVFAISVRIIGPIQLNVNIGGRRSDRGR
jgi:hypothetical protein